jgi:ring-1,2-phenylacetyl-CoA epoxidase subunit PaaD
MVMTLVDPRDIAETVTDPELPMLTLADLGVLRDVSVDDGKVVVTITPTYSGCPAMDAMRDDLVFALHKAGYPTVDIKVALSPAWSSDWISAEGRRKLADAGISPPGVSGPRIKGPVPLTLGPTVRTVHCPLCGSAQTELISVFGPTSCKSLHRCRSCAEPFEHVKEI